MKTLLLIAGILGILYLVLPVKIRHKSFFCRGEILTSEVYINGKWEKVSFVGNANKLGGWNHERSHLTKEDGIYVFRIAPSWYLHDENFGKRASAPVEQEPLSAPSQILKTKKLYQWEYDSLQSPDPSTLYIIIDEPLEPELSV